MYKSSNTNQCIRNEHEYKPSILCIDEITCVNVKQCMNWTQIIPPNLLPERTLLPVFCRILIYTTKTNGQIKKIEKSI